MTLGERRVVLKFNQEPAFYLKRAEEHEVTADDFIADGTPWMAEGYQILAGMYRETAASVAAQRA